MKCPVCGGAVRIIRRADGNADHYEPLGFDGEQSELPVLDEQTDRELREARKGKKTVAIVGVALSTATLAPYDDREVEIWALNEMYSLSWAKRITKLFQIHAEKSWKVDKKTKYGHTINSYSWLKKTNIPVYMRCRHEEIPFSIEFPLCEIRETLLGKLRLGDKRIHFYTSTPAYMIAMAIREGFERIELYGFEMTDDTDYAEQKPGFLFWIGLALGKGIEVYAPPESQYLVAPLYGAER